MKNQVLTLLLGGALLGTALIETAHAQREAPTRGERRDNRREQMNENVTPEQRQQRTQERMQERMRNATPEQRQQMAQRRQQMEQRMREAGIDPNDPTAWQRLRQAGGMGGPGAGAQIAAPNRDESRRQLMRAAGITEAEVQNAIIEFVNAQEAAREPLLRLARAAAASLATDGAQTVATEGDGLTSAFEAYEAAATADRQRYAADLAALDRRISFSSNTRLRSFLTLAGILNYDALALGGIPAVLAPPLMEAMNGERRAQAVN